MTVLNVFFGSAQTGVGFQFYDATGALIGARTTAGIVSLPEAGAYSVEIEVPADAAGVFWDSDTSEASENLADCAEPSRVLQVSFGSAQTGVGYQFFNAAGALIGTRTTAGIVSLPEAGAYSATAEIPADATGIYWSSDTSEASGNLDCCAEGDQPTLGQSGFLSAGFGTLPQLKARLLPQLMETYDTEGEWDVDLQQIGQAAAGAMNRFCNRELHRGVSATYSQSAGMSTISLDRYPVEALSALSLLTSDGTEDIMDSVYLLKSESGLIELVGYYGCYRDQVTATFTGGYWLGAGETTFATVTTAVTAGATQVSVPVPTGFVVGDAVAVSVERLAGTGQLTVSSFDTTGAEVVVTFTSAAVADDTFQVLTRFESVPGTSQPVGSTKLPAEIFEAWVMQSQAAMGHLNTLRGAGVQNSGDPVGNLSELTMLPAVTEILNSYKRYR